MQETHIFKENYHITEHKHMFKRSFIQNPRGVIFQSQYPERPPCINFCQLKAESKENSKQQMLLLAQVHHKLWLVPQIWGAHDVLEHCSRKGVQKRRGTQTAV